MTAKKPSTSEEEYIAKQEALGRHKAAVERVRAMNVEEREALSRLHYMKCPKCGNDLQATVFRGVTIDKCYSCNGSWLDAGELETLATHTGDVLRHVAEFFKKD